MRQEPRGSAHALRCERLPQAFETTAAPLPPGRSVHRPAPDSVAHCCRWAESPTLFPVRQFLRLSAPAGPALLPVRCALARLLEEAEPRFGSRRGQLSDRFVAVPLCPPGNRRRPVSGSAMVPALAHWF